MPSCFRIDSSGRDSESTNIQTTRSVDHCLGNVARRPVPLFFTGMGLPVTRCTTDFIFYTEVRRRYDLVVLSTVSCIITQWFIAIVLSIIGARCTRRLVAVGRTIIVDAIARLCFVTFTRSTTTS